MTTDGIEGLIDLSVIDEEDIKKVQEKKKKIDRVLEIIQENGLENDKEFMTEIEEVIAALKKEK